MSVKTITLWMLVAQLFFQAPAVHAEAIEASDAPAADPEQEPLWVDEPRDRDEEYYGPDLSEPRTIEEDLMKREFPMPQEPHPEPPKQPPTPRQYQPPRVRQASP